MATRYTVEALLQLRESPLCTKPSTLPPAEEWMGPPPETPRNAQASGRSATDRSRNDGALVDNANRRSTAERHVSRNSANPDDIILGPPRTTFSSATLSKGGKPFDNDKTSDRFATFRNRNGDGDSAERFRDRDRDGRGNFRRRGDNPDQDSDGWSTVKPRKSFGHEGAERFRPERFTGDRRSKDIQEEPGERPPRRNNFGEFGRDKDAEEGERPRRNGLNRNRTDQLSWSRGGNAEADPTPARERFDRAKSWRDRDDQGGENQSKPRERNFDRRWDHREQRQEREPEWMDEPAESTPKGHTEEDFKRFMESMKGRKDSSSNKPGTAAAPTAAPATSETAKADENSAPEKPQLKAVTTMEMGPDKFFVKFAQSPSTDRGTPTEGGRDAGPLKLKTASRFQNFFSSQENSQRSQPSTPAALAPVHEPNPLLAFANAGAAPGLPADVEPSGQSDAAEKVAFQALLQKLQKQSLQATPPSAGFSSPPATQGMGPKNIVTSPGPYAQYGQELRGDSLSRGIPQPNLDIHAPRPQQMTQSSLMRQEEDILQELMRQQQQHPMPTPGSARAGHNQSRNGSSNTEFLMTLMQSARNVPEPPRTEQLIRMPQPSRPAHVPPTPDREPDYHRERGMHGRPPAVAGFFDDLQLHHQEQEGRRQQPTQILQRQVPPGLDQINPASWMGNQQLPPGPGRPMIPPPGLAGNPRNGPVPGMFPPNFPMSGFPHPDAPAGPPRNMAPPPGFFGAAPPPGFMPPHPGMGGFQGGPEALAFGFDGRGMPPPGAFRRN